jgi:exonuclease III
MFRKVKIIVIAVYIPPNDKEKKKDIQQLVIKRIREGERKRVKVIIIGDFNDIKSRELDQSNVKSKRSQMLPLLAWLESSSCEDAYRKIHPYKKEYTWSNGTSNSRIDYIWASKELSQCIINCNIINSECITNSDHKISRPNL